MELNSVLESSSGKFLIFLIFAVIDSKINKFSINMSCKIIPVVDILNGIAVRAVAGDRANYKQLKDSTFKSTDVCRIIEVLLKLSRSSTLYIANLNGIAGDDSYDHILYKIISKFNRIKIWVDNGFRDLQGYSSFHSRFAHWCELHGQSTHLSENLVPVFGTETISDDSSYKQIFSKSDTAILSIDKKNNVILGLVTIERMLNQLPRNVILMNLDKVGTNSGPDLKWLKNMAERYPEVQFFGAGGLRNGEDHKNVSRHRAAGWLVGNAIFSLTTEFNRE